MCKRFIEEIVVRNKNKGAGVGMENLQTTMQVGCCERRRGKEGLSQKSSDDSTVLT